MFLNSIPDSKISQDFREHIFIPQDKVTTCKAYLLRLLDNIKSKNAYKNHIKPFNIM